jgi:hypothetical protein
MAENPNIVSQTQAGPRLREVSRYPAMVTEQRAAELKRKAPESRRWV